MVAHEGAQFDGPCAICGYACSGYQGGPGDGQDRPRCGEADGPVGEHDHPGRKHAAVDYIKKTKPNVVVIANTYQPKRINGTNEAMTPYDWTRSMQNLIDQFRPETDKLVLLGAPPAGPLINDCYGKRGSVPADCAGEVKGEWLNMAEAEQSLAAKVNGVWIDPRPWFCNSGACPAFAGSVPTKLDVTHMTPAYGVKIHPVIAEALTQAGVF